MTGLPDPITCDLTLLPDMLAIGMQGGIIALGLSFGPIRGCGQARLFVS